ncbi:hypothetical protein NEPAR07_0931 [Nematocida parisii]|nr:hypothetical protein NEPAR07_0931 [Nematocida parisii]
MDSLNAKLVEVLNLQKHLAEPNKELNLSDRNEIICGILRVYRREQLFQSDYGVFKSLAYNTFMVRVVWEVEKIETCTEEIVLSTVKNALKNTRCVVDSIKKIANSISNDMYRESYCNMMNFNYLSAIIQYGVLGDYILNDLKSSLFLYSVRPDLPDAKNMKESLFGMDELNGSTRIKKVMHILINHGGSLVKYNCEGKLESNIKNLDISYDSVLSLYIFLNAGYADVYMPISLIESSFLMEKINFMDGNCIHLVPTLFFFLYRGPWNNTSYPYSVAFEYVLNTIQYNRYVLSHNSIIAFIKEYFPALGIDIKLYISKLYVYTASLNINMNNIVIFGESSKTAPPKVQEEHIPQIKDCICYLKIDASKVEKSKKNHTSSTDKILSFFVVLLILIVLTLAMIFKDELEIFIWSIIKLFRDYQK